MGSRHFERLNREDSATNETWREMLRIAVVVSLITGLIWAACTALREAVHGVTHQLFGQGGGDPRLAALGLVVALLAGALLRSTLSRQKEWKEAAGDGVALALENYQLTYDHEGDDPRPRYARPDFGIALRKGVMTLLTLGSGASGGMEAPVVLIGESLSAGTARLLRVRSEYELRTYQIAGIAAAVGTLLGAPFTAALFSAELAYGDRIIYRKLAWGLWAGVITYALNNQLHGYQPLFHSPLHSPVYKLSEYGAAVAVALTVSVPLALGFGHLGKQTGAWLDRVPPFWRDPAAAMTSGMVALIAWFGFGVGPEHTLGMGEATIRAILYGEAAVGVWWVLGLSLIARLFTTLLTIKGGGSAGILVPTMVVGGTAGALTASTLDAAMGWGLDPALFAVVGIASSLVAVIGVPLSAIALVLEVFGKQFGPPALLAVGVTYLVTLKFKLYKAPGAEVPNDIPVESATTEPTLAQVAPPASGEAPNEGPNHG
jgi:CIC family chloride channel protein